MSDADFKAERDRIFACLHDDPAGLRRAFEELKHRLMKEENPDGTQIHQCALYAGTAGIKLIEPDHCKPTWAQPAPTPDFLRWI